MMNANGYISTDILNIASTYKHFKIIINHNPSSKTRNATYIISESNGKVIHTGYSSLSNAVTEAKTYIDSINEYHLVLRTPTKDLPLFAATPFFYQATRDLLTERLAKGE